MPRPEARGALDVSHAVALGALHGPAELLPISSSGHVALVPWLLHWPYADLEPELQRVIEGWSSPETQRTLRALATRLGK